jgi:phosphonoacetaldehyde hydrolase
MSTIIAVLFDWAGTVIDFGSRAPAIAMGEVFRRADLPVDETTIRRAMGMAKREHVISILSEPEVATRWERVRGASWSDADVDRLMDWLEPAMRDAAGRCRELIPGVVEAVSVLRSNGVKIGSTTGYTRAMMEDIVPAAASQGYRPDVIVCAGETALGRPAPLMLWKALAELGAWPVARCVAVDDAPVGIAAGRNAGLWTVGVAASGNGVGLTHAAFEALPPKEREARMAPAIEEFRGVGADIVIPSVGSLARAVEVIETALAAGAVPGAAPTRALLR